MTAPDVRRDPLPAHLAVALCIAACTAWALAAVLWFAPDAAAWLSWDGTAAIAAWRTAVALQFGASWALASGRGTRPAAIPAGAACAAFGLSLVAQSAAMGFGYLPRPFAAHVSFAADVAVVQARDLVCVGQALLAVALARIAGQRFAWARALGVATLAVVAVSASTEDVAAMGSLGVSAAHDAVFVARVVPPAMLGVLSVCVGLGLNAAAGRSRSSLGDAIAALPLLFGARAGMALVLRLAPGGGAGAQDTVLHGVVHELTMAPLMLACVLRVALTPTRVRSRWAVAALAIAAAGVGLALLSAGSPMEAAQGASAACLGAVGASSTIAGAGAHLAGLAATLAVLVALVQMGRTVAERAVAMRIRNVAGPVMIVGAATMQAPRGEASSPMLSLAALAAAALATYWMVPVCAEIARALDEPLAFAGEAEEPPSDAQPLDEPAAELGAESAPFVASDAVTRNPYAPPSTDATRGRIARPRLARWRAQVGRAIPWSVGPLVVYGVVSEALVSVGGLCGNAKGTLAGFFSASLHVTAAFAVPLTAASLVAHALFTRGVFEATRPPRVRVPGLGRALIPGVRLAVATAFAAHVASALMTMLYGWKPVADFAPWVGMVDQLAYAAAAFYAARLLAAGQRASQARAATVLSLGCMGVGLLGLVMLEGEEAPLRAVQIDAYALPVIAALAVMVATATRELLRTPTLHPRRAST